MTADEQDGLVATFIEAFNAARGSYPDELLMSSRSGSTRAGRPERCSPTRTTAIGCWRRTIVQGRVRGRPTTSSSTMAASRRTAPARPDPLAAFLDDGRCC